MTPTLMELIAEWKAAHPKAWPFGLELKGDSFTYMHAGLCHHLALPMIESAVMDDILKLGGVARVEFYPRDEEGNESVNIIPFGSIRVVWGDAPTRLQSLLLADWHRRTTA